MSLLHHIKLNTTVLVLSPEKSFVIEPSYVQSFFVLNEIVSERSIVYFVQIINVYVFIINYHFTSAISFWIRC